MVEYNKAYFLKRNYTQDVKDQIQLYTIDKETRHTNLIGSYSYRSSNASDIDFLEEIKRKNPEEIIRFFSANLKRVVNNLRLKKNQIFLEVKCGLDHLYYDLDYGNCVNGVYTMPDDLYNNLLYYKQHKFLNKEEFDILAQIALKKISDQYDYETFYNTMRKRYVLRWNFNEIMRGYKKLVSIENIGYKYFIENGIVEKSSINIEGIYINRQNKFIECSNFLWLEYLNKQGQTMMINMPDLYLQYKDEYFGEDLKRSMYVLLYSVTSNYNPFKAIKRMFSYARHFKLDSLLEITYKIINSMYGKLYNLNSQMKTISKVLETNAVIDVLAVINQLDEIRWEIQSIILRDFNANMVANVINSILFNNNKIIDKNLFINVLTFLTKYIGNFINDKTQDIMELIGLFPLPDQLMPKIKPF